MSLSTVLEEAAPDSKDNEAAEDNAKSSTPSCARMGSVCFWRRRVLVAVVMHEIHVHKHNEYFL